MFIINLLNLTLLIIFASTIFKTNVTIFICHKEWEIFESLDSFDIYIHTLKEFDDYIPSLLYLYTNFGINDFRLLAIML